MSFKILTNWLERGASQAVDELEATLAAFRLVINDKNVTEYSSMETGRGVVEAVHEKLHIPAYFLAEWIAENWWALLYEPRKSDRNNDPTFYSRHSMIYAQHGFALPDVQLQPLGDNIRIFCLPREAAGPDVKFRQSAETKLSRSATEAVLKAFVIECIKRLAKFSVSGTPLQRAWDNIEQTQPTEVFFCQLAGALGVNPYEIDAGLIDVIDSIFESIGENATMDLCMASTPNELATLVGTSDFVAEQLKGKHESTLTPLERLRVQPDSISLPSWRLGYNAALNVRKLLDIRAEDDAGCDKFLDTLNVNTSQTDGNNSNSEVLFAGAVSRQEQNARFVLLQKKEEARRFAALRGVYLALLSKSHTTRLMTDTLTRDQQASRAFAAEMLVPYDCVRSKLVNGKLPSDEVYEIARRRSASVDVVTYQAVNKGIVIKQSL